MQTQLESCLSSSLAVKAQTLLKTLKTELSSFPHGLVDILLDYLRTLLWDVTNDSKLERSEIYYTPVNQSESWQDFLESYINTKDHVISTYWYWCNFMRIPNDDVKYVLHFTFISVYSQIPSAVRIFVTKDDHHKIAKWIIDHEQRGCPFYALLFDIL